MITVGCVEGCKYLNERQNIDYTCKNICKADKIDLAHVGTKTVLREQATLRRLMAHCMKDRKAVL